MKVFIAQPIQPVGVEMIQEVAEVRSASTGRPMERQEFLKEIRDCDAVILPWHTDIMDKEAIGLCPNLKIIGRHGVGYENIDLDEATRRGIYCTYVPVHTETVADTSFLLLMATARRITEADRFVKDGKWDIGGEWVAWKFLGLDVHHKTIGVIGAGRIGAGVCRRAKGFGMRILYHDVMPKPELEAEVGAERVDLETLLREADFISVNSALNDTSRSLLGPDQFKLMKPTAIIANTARGPVINQAALVEALRNGTIAGAGLDVFVEEPLPPNDPLMKLNNVVLFPHIGSAAMEIRQRMATTVAEDVVSVLTGKEPVWLLNPAVKEIRPLAKR